MKSKKKIGILILLVIIAAAGIWFYTRPKEVTNYDVAFEEDQEKP